MKIAHYQYVGYPRSGSTFLHGVFQQHPYLQACTSSVSKEGLYLSQDRYRQTFDKFNYSINMNPLVIFPSYGANDDYFKLADAVTTKFFTCVRNPYHMIDSLYGYGSPIPWHDTILSKLSDYVQHISRLESLITKPFKLFYFDDLIIDSQKFVTDVYNWLEIPCEIPNDIDQIYRNESSKTYYTGNSLIAVRTNQEPVRHYDFSNQDILDINLNILKFENLVGRNFDHWKRQAI